VDAQDWTRFPSGDRLKREAKHLAAVARTLQWADEAAERGDHFDAVAWLETLEAIASSRRSTRAGVVRGLLRLRVLGRPRNRRLTRLT
jgi:hypothetical protein